ncbi:hypothetical protein PENSPDRAFT_64563 [Peniophora sp. CONT]|nr:hypothetical protein PENSPDRAFT_64563 [Peniophora sp. CONT]
MAENLSRGDEVMSKPAESIDSMDVARLSLASTFRRMETIYSSDDPKSMEKKLEHERAKKWANALSSDGSSSAICSRCGKRDKPRVCSQCKSTSYCGVDCQKADWKTHKLVCSPKSSGAEGLEKRTLMLAERSLRHADIHGNIIQLACEDLHLVRNPERAQTHCVRLVWDLIPVDNKHESKDRLMLSLSKSTIVRRTHLTATEAMKVAQNQVAFEAQRETEYHRRSLFWPPPSLIGIVPIIFSSGRRAPSSVEPRLFIHFIDVRQNLVDAFRSRDTVMRDSGLPIFHEFSDYEDMKLGLINDSITSDVKNVYKLRWRPSDPNDDSEEASG